MPAFAKNPRFIVGAILVLWVAYVLYANFQLETVPFYLLPGATLQFSRSAVMMGSAIFGALITLVVQWLWRRRSSKNASPAAAASSKTLA